MAWATLAACWLATRWRGSPSRSGGSAHSSCWRASASAPRSAPRCSFALSGGEYRCESPESTMVACRGLRSYSLVLACVLGSCGAATVQAPGAEHAAATGTRSDTIAASAAYTPQIGDVWTFVNAYGDTTTITTVAAPDSIACRKGNNVIWRYHKTNARAYWLPGVTGATIDFVLHQDPDSSWRSTSSV